MNIRIDYDSFETGVCESADSLDGTVDVTIDGETRALPCRGWNEDETEVSGVELVLPQGKTKAVALLVDLEYRACRVIGGGELRRLPLRVAEGAGE